MSNISVAEILKIHGKWIEAKPFVSLISQKLKISERMAYIKIKKATKRNEILRIPLFNRRVLYGLADFGRPIETNNKQNNEQLKELKMIGNLSLVSVDDAWRKLGVFIHLLPKHLKNKVRKETFPIISDRENYPDEYVALTIALSKISEILLEEQESEKGDCE